MSLGSFAGTHLSRAKLSLVDDHIQLVPANNTSELRIDAHGSTHSGTHLDILCAVLDLAYVHLVGTNPGQFSTSQNKKNKAKVNASEQTWSVSRVSNVWFPITRSCSTTQSETTATTRSIFRKAPCPCFRKQYGFYQ